MMSLMLFLINPIISDLLGKSSLTDITKFMIGEFNISTVYAVLLMLCVSILGVNLGVAFYKSKRYLNQQNEKLLYENNKIAKIVLYTIIFLSPFCLFKLWYDLKSIMTYGYLAAFITIDRSPFILRVSWYLVQILFPLLFIAPINKKKFIYYFLFYMFINSMAMLKGSRGSLFVPLSFFIWYYYKYYNTKGINIKKAFLFLIGIVGISQLFLLYRGEKVNDIPISELVGYFFQSQGVSFQVNCYYFDYKDELASPSHFYCLAPILDLYTRFTDKQFATEKSDYTIHKSYSLGDKLMHRVNPNLYENGNGLGSSFIAELYALEGYWSLFIGSLIIGLLIMKLENNTITNGFHPVFMWYWIQNLIWMPRGSLLSLISQLLFSFFIYYFLVLLFNTYNRQIKTSQ